jgi:glycine cleavage system aminomethyltransferase T
MVRDGRARLGEKVAVWHLGQQMQALIVPPCAFDPGGERMNA